MNESVTHRRQRGLLTRLFSARNAVSAPAPAGTPDPRPPDDTPPNHQPPGPAETPLGHRHHDALAVLTAARGVIRRGWTQNTWYVMETPAGRRRTVQSVFPRRLDRTHVVEACLVGAVMHGAWQQSPRPEHAYPAIDALWHTLFDGHAPDAEPVGPLCAPPVRLARVRDLTTWNDRRYRTKDEVLGLLDRTAVRIAEADRRAGQSMPK